MSDQQFEVPCPKCNGTGNLYYLGSGWGDCIDCGNSMVASVTVDKMTAEQIQAERASLQQQLTEIESKIIAIREKLAILEGNNQ